MCSGNLYAYNPFVDEEKKLWTVYEFNLKKSLLIYIYIYIYIYWDAKTSKGECMNLIWKNPKIYLSAMRLHSIQLYAFEFKTYL